MIFFLHIVQPKLQHFRPPYENVATLILSSHTSIILLFDVAIVDIANLTRS